MTRTNYIPGVCNINPDEVRKRRQAGHFGLLITLILIALALILHVSWFFRIVVVLPAYLATTGYLQARNRFCVGYASAKQHHADVGEVVDITDKKALEIDRKKMRTMNLQASIIAALVTAIVCVIPL